MTHARLAFVSVALVTASCGGRAPTEEEVSAVFARIQVEEAHLVTAGERARDAELPCGDRRRAAEAGCAAAAGLCEDAATLDDADAALRCDRARSRCDELRRRVEAACPGGET
jgi:hypothetical protein